MESIDEAETPLEFLFVTLIFVNRSVVVGTTNSDLVMSCADNIENGKNS
jgi:hypothetical protein